VTSELDEAAFETLAAQTLAHFASRIEDQAPDLETDLEGGVLTIETEDGAIFLLNKHAPLRQLWLSSPVSGAGHFAFDVSQKSWLSTRGGDPLVQILQRELSVAAGTEVSFG
jgi:frataxin